jgi:hypothetical protein
VREALLEQSLDLKIANQVETNSRPNCSTKYIIDLVLPTTLHASAANAQIWLDSIKIMARRVGLEISKTKTEFMLVGNWSSSLELRILIEFRT